MIQTLRTSQAVSDLYELASPCKLCPRECGTKRDEGEFGFCQAPMAVRISSTGPHYGEEPPISGSKGSGTIFFSYCTMSCRFCQNYPISQLYNGYEITVEQLANTMLELENRGCHNINLVTPTHYTPQIAHAIEIAKSKDLNIPIVYNCSGFESLKVLRLLDGFIDIYLPDAKYSSNYEASRNSNAMNYVDHNRAALKEMYRQVGKLVLNDDCIAKQGLLVRHLVLPGERAGSREVLYWISKNLPDIHVSLMSQYFPCHKVLKDPELNRNITEREYDEAVSALEEVGISNGWIQPF